MVRIFISYRRADSQHVADRIHDHMAAHFGADNTFQDVDAIPFGVDFRVYLRDAVNRCDVVLAVIGPHWARIMRERAHEPNDFVRIEIENALLLDKLVIPVLVMGAQMPDANDVPESIRDLCWRNAAHVRPNPDFKRDCMVLVNNINSILSEKPPRQRVEDILPAPFAWIEIPGAKGKKFRDAPYAIAKYPITNAQFQAFVDAENGYRLPQWWDYSQAAVQWRSENRQPRARAFEGDDHPRANVTWYEAMAFCRWLSEETGLNITLPTEQQWQYAAQGDDGRDYPFGPQWDCKRCNNSVEPCDSVSTTPVTRYEGAAKGDSFFGVSDMAGNVWEWCLTKYATGGNELDGEDDRVLRGGSWFTTSLQTTSAASTATGSIHTAGSTISVFAFPALNVLVTEFLISVFWGCRGLCPAKVISPKANRNFCPGPAFVKVQRARLRGSACAYGSISR